MEKKTILFSVTMVTDLCQISPKFNQFMSIYRSLEVHRGFMLVDFSLAPLILLAAQRTLLFHT